ncbi:MAG TPA: cell division protein FtsL [Methylomirabilota bacterium]
MTLRQRLQREHDPRFHRSLALTLTGALALILCGLGVVGLRVQQVHLSYQLDALRAERARMEVQIRQLEVQVATLRSPGRIESRARQLGLTTPTRDQIRMAREFVAGTTGLAAERHRVATLATSPGQEAMAGVTREP